MFNEFCQFITTLLQYTDRLRSFYIALCVVNALSSIFSTVLNLLVLFAIKRSRSLHTPSYVLLSTLAFSDFAVGCVTQPLYIAFRVAELTGTSHIYCGLGIAYDFLANFFGGMSFLVIASISIDRFLALYLREKYRLVVTRKRALVATLFLIICAALYGLVGLLNRKAYYVFGIILGPFLLVITSLNYININRLLRKHGKRNTRFATQQSPSSYGKTQNGIHIIRYKRTLKTLMYVFFVFLLCYIPYILCGLVKLIMKTRNDAIQISAHVTVTLILMNSSLNPLLYCWRIPEIRKAVGKMLRLDKQEVLNSGDATQQMELQAAVTVESGC